MAERTGMTKSGFCAFGAGGHGYCVTKCDCTCHDEVDAEETDS